MTLSPDTLLGSFQIVGLLGAGGMGEVYRARDTKLGRDVAIKVLPEEFTRNKERLARFEREARLLASLDHANIAGIFDLQEADGIHFIVMQLVEGETLRERIARGPLKVEEALEIFGQIAEALDAAHERRVVHRDLKPDNVKLTEDGKVKILDFGLAKGVEAGGVLDEDSGTWLLDSPPAAETVDGTILGTPAYMSPEQARGKRVDKRTDIWAFGCSLYEALTGRMPFSGETVTDALAAVLEREPDWEALPDKTPAGIRRLLHRCLEKDPKLRLRDIGEAGIEIDEALAALADAPTVGLTPADRAGGSKAGRIVAAAAAIIVVLCAVVFWAVFIKSPGSSAEEIRLVVLPFENLGPEEDDWFAAGITDAITARLAVIQGLGVISRQSAVQYKDRTKTTRQIARELDVDYILEGTVQRERPTDPKSRVRVIPQLIRGSDDSHIWAETYDNDMSEVFQMQSDLAERVARALDVAILETEREGLQSRPTENIEAYGYYLHGNDYFETGRHTELEHDIRMAIQMYEKAIDLDPSFALAHAQLARAHMLMYWFRFDGSEQRLAMARRAVDEAFRLRPDLAEVRLARGHYFYHGYLDYDRALEDFRVALKIQPKNSEILAFIGYVQRRQGKFEEAVESLEKARALNPLPSGLIRDLGMTFTLLRQYPEAERCLKQAIALAPDQATGYNGLAALYLVWKGDVTKARAVLEEGLAAAGTTEDLRFEDNLIMVDILDRKFQNALDRLTENPHDVDTQFRFVPDALYRAKIYTYMNMKSSAEPLYEEARALLEAKVQESPEDDRFHSSLGLAYAGLGRKKDAIREGKRAIEFMPVTKEAWRGLDRVEDLAGIYAMVGEFDLAIDRLEYLLSTSSEVSVPLLRLDPDWDPLRNHPRFQKLVGGGK